MGKPKIRLAGSREGNDYEGRVEAFREGIWGTICLSFTDMDLVDRICQELGFVSGIIT